MAAVLDLEVVKIQHNMDTNKIIMMYGDEDDILIKVFIVYKLFSN